MSTRSQNQRKFGSWKDLPNGARRYWFEIAGRHGWKSSLRQRRDSAEATIRFYQEIYNESGQLVEIHEKYPVDTGHKKIE